ncbi:MAG: aminopeptidase P family protein [Alphaproteobacteria bacterium]|nr:aminopeptidase P family protein [Alphaproteobacteria bacterium]
MTARLDFKDRLQRLRRKMQGLGIDGFLVPSADAFQSEYVPPSDRRLAWISGFTGSMGQAVILRRRAALFVDGRYTLQAGRECDDSLFEIVPTAKTSLTAWLALHLKPGQKLGIDPWLVTAEGARQLGEVTEKAGGSLVSLTANPLDALWADRPPAPASKVHAHPLAYAGEESASKCRRVANLLALDGADATLVTAPDSVAWLLNIRGTDIPYAPLVRAFALLHKNVRVDLFLDPGRVTAQLAHDRLTPSHPGDGELNVNRSLKQIGRADLRLQSKPLNGFDFRRPALDRHIRLLPPETLEAELKRLGRTGARVRLDPAQTPLILADRLKASKVRVLHAPDPCQGLKAIKNEAEIKGARAAHRRDGCAVVRFLAGLRAGIQETEAAERVDALRAQEKLAQGPSFATISAFGANGAIVHYRARKRRDALLKPGGLYLLDSGGQYLDGTTDVTRTVFIGPGRPSPEMKRLFTLVLKGHIALASAVFPKGTNGSQLDPLARQFLWQAGLDYDHGTGHGVGSFLSVHEGPQRIAKTGGTAPLEAGMILSIEPGYYRNGAFGIRLENLALVVPKPGPTGAERDLLGFEILTQIPFDKRLIATRLLTDEERRWINAYHKRVKTTLKGILDDRASAWLAARTAALP